MYTQNIKLVRKPGALCAGLGQENGVYTQQNTINRWSITLAFSNREENYFKYDKVGINQHHSTSTFIISTWFVTLIYSGLN